MHEAQFGSYSKPDPAMTRTIGLIVMMGRASIPALLILLLPTIINFYYC